MTGVFNRKTMKILPYNKDLKQWSQELRREATPQENRLWYDFLRNHSMSFTRQKPIENFIVDFACRKAKLVIELDGRQHQMPDAKNYDQLRTKELNRLGMHVMRFTNAQVDSNFKNVCETIQKWIDENV